MTQPFATIRSEGGLLPPDLLARIGQGDRTLPGLTPAAYRLDEGQQFGEAITRSWNRLLPAWHAFRLELAKLPVGDAATVLTRERLLQPLLQELGYGRVAPLKKAISVDDREYAISHSWGDVPIHLLGAGTSLEVRTAAQKGAAKSSPHGLVQDLLNRSDAHLWALISNGLVLRLLRDHHSLTTQAYVEVDLEALFDGERYSDFALMWLVFHQSRIEPQEDKIERCWLEQWFALSRNEGLQALDDLRAGVEAAIVAFGRGFLAHPHNAALAQDLRDGVLDRQDYYRELLRLVYRLIFLFSAEDRGVLLDPNAPEAARDRYRRFYATHRLRGLAGQTRGGSHGDLWQALRAVMHGLDDGCAPLALPALGSFLWSKEAAPHVDRCELANSELLAAIRALSYLQRHKQRFPVSWRTVAADELGSIYESLLELHPKLDPFELVTAAGNERKKTGSYYTPTSLVDCLLDSALDPAIDAAVKGKSRADAEAALLALKVVDPACGSGHFLVAAARRLARRLARVRTGDDEPSPRELQHALRDVVGRCIHGVDLNEMAVELCKVALWMEAVEPGKPLSFLDAHIQHGNAPLGATPALLARGIPDGAWDAIEGDDKATARALKKRNREARKAAEKSGQTDVFGVVGSPGTAADLATAARDALAGADDAVADVRARKRRWEALQSSQSFRDAVFVADTWCAAFVWPKQEGALAAEAPSHDAFVRIRQDPSAASKALRREVSKLASQYTFFHWHLAFPEVFGIRDVILDEDVFGCVGGFDCVLGNPPWERVKLQEKEFFAGRHDKIASAENAAERKKLIARLPEADPSLWDAWMLALRRAEGESHWLRQAGRYPLCGQGDINTYSIFAELNRSVMGERGRVGCILPSGIATDDTTKEFFAAIVTQNQLVSLYHFENEEFIFPTVHHAFRFCLVTLGRVVPRDHRVEMVFYARQVSQLAEPERRIALSAADFIALNPNTKTCPTFRWRRDAEISKAIYRSVPIMCREDDTPAGNPWALVFRTRLWHMAEDAEFFRTSEDLVRGGWRRDGNRYVQADEVMVPLYEAKMIHLFDHRFSTYEGQTEAQARQGKCPELSDADHADGVKQPLPYYWVPATEVDKRLEEVWSRSWLLGWRDICRSSDLRTVITAAIPRTAVGDKYLLMFPGEQALDGAACLLANMASIVFDFCSRQKVGGTNLKLYLMKQLPVLSPSQYRQPSPWDHTTTLRDWITTRVLELTYTAADLKGFAHDFDFEGPPFSWSPDRRALLRAELDAVFFHLYGVPRDDTAYVLDTFPVLRDKETREQGEYRTKRLVLERYDAIAAAITSKRPYMSPLSLPADSDAAQDVVRGNVIPLRPASTPEVRPKENSRPAASLPRFDDAPNLAKIRAGSWQRPRVDHSGEIGATIVAVLKRCVGATDVRDVRLAALLCLEPHLLRPMLSADEQKAWARVVGVDAKPSIDASIDVTLQHWGEALRGLRARRRLVEDEVHSTWAPGDGVEAIDTRGWADDRAAYVLHVLARARQSKEIEAVVLQFPTSIREWVTRAA